MTDAQSQRIADKIDSEVYELAKKRLPRTVEEARAHLKSIGLVRKPMYAWVRLALLELGQSNG